MSTPWCLPQCLIFQCLTYPTPASIPSVKAFLLFLKTFCMTQLITPISPLLLLAGCEAHLAASSQNSSTRAGRKSPTWPQGSRKLSEQMLLVKRSNPFLKKPQSCFTEQPPHASREHRAHQWPATSRVNAQPYSGSIPDKRSPHWEIIRRPILNVCASCFFCNQKLSRFVFWELSQVHCSAAEQQQEKGAAAVSW